MKWTRIMDLPVAANVCGQIVREVEMQPRWSMAHVIMNPKAVSLLHEHHQMSEIYVVTRGFGELRSLEQNVLYDLYRKVAGGSVHTIEPGVAHVLENESLGTLEHLVFAFPPFDPKDVHMVHPASERFNKCTERFCMPEVQDCFDGAKIAPYAFPRFDMSIAFGWVGSAAEERKPHFHKNATEWVYGVEGEGKIVINGIRWPISHGDWFRIDPGECHSIYTKAPEGLIVVCISSPMFDKSDVYYEER